jgi:hypothetical protein
LLNTLNRKKIVDHHTIGPQMVIIAESLYYAKSSEEIVKRISEITPIPESLSINGPYAKFISKSLIKSIAIYEFHESKLLEALEYIAKHLSSCNGVTGYTYHTRIWEDEKRSSGL